MDTVFEPKHYKLTIDDYYKLAEIGILNEDSRVELIEGELIEMPPSGLPHAGLINRLNRMLVLATANSAVVAVQNPVFLPPCLVPQPDFALL